MPALPQDASLPNYAARQAASQQYGTLAGQQNADFSAARSGAQQALAGYGGWKFLEDDPNTPQREDLLPQFDPNAGPGQREKGAIRGAANQSNATGMLYSSFANQNIAAATQRISLEAQAIVSQYAGVINQIARDYSNRGADLATQWAGLYGQDSAWAVDHPPPAPPVFIPGTASDPSWMAHPGNPEGSAYVPPQNTMSYADFLRGRKSTTALAHAWDTRYNSGRRFG
jgi:hypothetical protein